MAFILGMMFARTGSMLWIIFFPMSMVSEMFGDILSPQLIVLIPMLLMGQYLSYFLFIYLLLKILRKLKITGEPGTAKEESEKDLSDS